MKADTGKVALRKESVDRNICSRPLVLILQKVALRKESVDRNKYPKPAKQAQCLSLSARRAWIEIGIAVTGSLKRAGRSPQGERG